MKKAINKVIKGNKNTVASARLSSQRDMTMQQIYSKYTKSNNIKQTLLQICSQYSQWNQKDQYKIKREKQNSFKSVNSLSKQNKFNNINKDKNKGVYGKNHFISQSKKNFKVDLQKYPIQSLRYKSIDSQEKIASNKNKKYFRSKLNENRRKQQNQSILLKQNFKSLDNDESNFYRIKKNNCLKQENLRSARQIYSQKKAIKQNIKVLSSRQIGQNNLNLVQKQAKYKKCKKRQRRFLTQETKEKKKNSFQWENTQISAIIQSQNQISKQLIYKNNEKNNKISVEQNSILQNINQIQQMLSNNYIQQNFNKNMKQNQKIQIKNQNKRKLNSIDQCKEQVQPHLQEKQQNSIQLTMTKKLFEIKNQAQSLPTLESIEIMMHQNSIKRKNKLLNKYNPIMRSIEKLKHIFPKGFFKSNSQDVGFI